MNGDGEEQTQGSKLLADPLIEKNISLQPKKREEELSKRKSKAQRPEDSPPSFIEYICCCLFEPSKPRKSEAQLETADDKLKGEKQNQANGIKKLGKEKKQKAIDNLKIINSLMSYPKGKLFILHADNNQGILAKITTKNVEILTEKKKKVLVKIASGGEVGGSMFSKESTSSANKLKEELEPKQEIEIYDQFTSLFMRYYDGVQLDPAESFSYTVPEKLGRHLAERLKKYDHVIDGFAGIGSQAIQLATAGIDVVAFERNSEKCQRLAANSAVYGVRDKIEIINDSFVQMRHQKRNHIGACLIHPEYSTENPEHCSYESFNADLHLSPKLIEVLPQALSVTKNLTLLLPKYTAPRDLAKQLLAVAKKIRKDSYFSSIEIELLHVNNKLDKFAIYLGGHRAITEQEEREFFINFLNDTESTYSSGSASEIVAETTPFIRYIIQKFGKLRLTNIITEFCGKKRKKTEIDFRKFLDYLMSDKKLINSEEFQQFFTPQKTPSFLLKTVNTSSFTFDPVKFFSVERSVLEEASPQTNHIKEFSSPEFNEDFSIEKPKFKKANYLSTDYRESDEERKEGFGSLSSSKMNGSCCRSTDEFHMKHANDDDAYEGAFDPLFINIDSSGNVSERYSNIDCTVREPPLKIS